MTTEDRAQHAVAVAQRRIALGERDQAALLERVAATVIRDKLVPPHNMFFRTHPETRDILVSYEPSPEQYYKIHPHALRQLADKVGIPLAYVNRLYAPRDEWRTDLLAHNFARLFHKTTFPGVNPRFLHRLVGNELRGFLSRRFNRHLASLPMLRAFVESYRAVNAVPIEANSSDVRVSLKAYIPNVFEAFPGQYICVGAEWSNSDFGAGKLMVSQTIWDPLRGSDIVIDEPVSRVHLGSIIEESDIEMSEETMSKEVDAQASAIRDAVAHQLGQESIDRLLRVVKVAHEEQIPLSKLRGQWSRFLMKKELESVETLLNSQEVVDLPPAGMGPDGKPLPSKWWASSVLSYLANKTEDADRKAELQREAGKILSDVSSTEGS